MIYTVTANPSIDYVMNVPTLDLGLVNRANHDVKLPGGKGINVSQILTQLQIPSIARGFVGGFTGQFIEQSLQQKKIKTQFTTVHSDSRINVKVKTDADEETEINGVGPTISQKEQQDFENQFSDLTPEDIVVMSGSLPASLSVDFYKDLLPTIQAANSQFVIDTTGQALLETLPFHPLLVKPNHHELAELFDTKINDFDDIIKYGRKLLDLGAQHVLVSMAGDGAILVTKEHAYLGNAPKGKLVNSVGSGDSMIAGFVGTFAQTNDALESFKMGLACGTATAFSEDLASRSKIDEIYPQITIKTLQ